MIARIVSVITKNATAIKRIGHRDHPRDACVIGILMQEGCGRVRHDEHLRGLIVDRKLEQATAEFFRVYGSEFLGYITNVTNDLDVAREIYSQFAEDFWRGLATFKPRAMVRTWAYRVAKSAIARYYRDPYRKRGRRLMTDELDRLLVETASAFFSTQTTPEEKVRRIRALLSPVERELLALRVERAMTWDEVAEILECSSVAVRKRFQRVREKVRGQL